jgi:hypothetical protein
MRGRCASWEDQEEVPADSTPELVAFHEPRSLRSDISDIDNLDKVLKALALLTQAIREPVEGRNVCD